MLDGGPDPPIARGNFEWGKGRPIVKYRDTLRPRAKTAKLIEMPFGLWAQIGRRNLVLDGGPAILMDVAMATNFWTKIAINWFCVKDSDRLWRGFQWSADCNADTLHVSDVVVVTTFGIL